MRTDRSELRRVAAWRAEMSDGCSVPAVLRLVIPQETEDECAMCERHDRAYYYGGSCADRKTADRQLRTDLMSVGVWAPKAWGYWAAVRVGGAPWLKIKGVSWAFAEDYFRYSARPAVDINGP